MKAVVCQNSELTLRDLPEPVPGPGQVLVEVQRCGICGSDLHLRYHCDHMKELAERVGAGANFPSSTEAVVFGHEFCAQVLDYGPGCQRRIKPGTRVVAQPMLRTGQGIINPGLSALANGAYAERMVLQEPTLVPVPSGLSSELAALTEPMAVGWHAVRRSEIKKRDVAIVIGCGPVGLAVVCALKALGVATVVASDFSAGRRRLAEACGADVVINPRDTSPYANWEEFGFFMDTPSLMEFALATREKLGRLPLPWWHVWRVAEAIGGPPPRPVIFECVGVPGVVQQIIDGAPLMSRVIVAGVCMQVDRYEPALAVMKEIDLRFVVNHTPLEYRDTVHMIAEGRFNCAPLITGEVGLGGVDAAFTALKDPETHAKILIDPRSTATRPVPLPRGGA
jgi:threonine dehydrogenase-like Zn-dependent dehydrogenase